MVAADRETKLRPGKRQRRVRLQQGLTRHLRDCNGCKDDAPEGKAQGCGQDIKGEPAARSCDCDAIGGHAKPLQYDRRIRGVGHGAAWAAGGQAFLKPRHF
jgi:hypothetical protein